ncbi:hypothetical protein F3Y22_tig00111000pilonHSYRG00006 [Hibiscus syriacus]|uniref:Uncharacterized protein n=1 Tax=Hibiscus syriacus TaxID=106335 RepID=A0A6A2Z7X1_HIBSY|nr:hypothetical protein F3Y22_tig00111000pilonHSYRG00006 [Hibiscus syriacus]
MRTYLPEAELLNGQAAMIGFFMAYAVDGLTGMDMIGQTGNLRARRDCLQRPWCRALEEIPRL